ncbi:MarR family winged helix-turn-helix transcriptional regulator [Nioella sp. MMSF_3534]|jgi:DNA-binding MarR family transcriptional regulator|uniref:MarR family winged helix-turn-helix transcriptional regulator n=1 Tax=Nioella sp. MMSF_3534 TaxID=3046720 RepID=UPI00273F55D5|nr:MarR family transcriptional regulator [Nioella sp. MMSF_3534]
MSTNTPFVLDDFLPYQLAVVAERVSGQFARHYKEMFGLSRSEWRVLAHLSQQTAVSVREISAQAALDKSKVSRAVSRLEEMGYISKTTSPADRRLVVLALTESGRGIINALTPIAERYQTEVLKSLAPDAEGFQSALKRLMAEPAQRG